MYVAQLPQINYRQNVVFVAKIFSVNENDDKNETRNLNLQHNTKKTNEIFKKLKTTAITTEWKRKLKMA